MERRNNYLIQAEQAKQRFLTYNQSALIKKFQMKQDDSYLYVNFLCQLYRISRTSGDLERLEDGRWLDGNSYEEVMTLLDLLCDSREDRCLSGRWTSAESLGRMFHRNLLEERPSTAASRFDSDPEGLRRACLAMEGVEIPGADIGYAVELFDGLRIGLQFWHGDEEFLPRLRFLWDENALQYLRYETTYFATDLFVRRILEKM